MGTSSVSSKAGLQYGIIMLNSVYSTLKSLLRTGPELFNQDRAPADNLTGNSENSVRLSNKIELLNFSSFFSCSRFKFKGIGDRYRS